MNRRWAAAALLAAAGATAQTVSADAQFDLGRRYRNGDGVVRDAGRGFVLIEHAARSGHVPAMFILSNMLAEGEGVARDAAQARRWLEAAAEQEYPEALQQLALNLRDGSMGFAPDEVRSAQLLRAAAHAMKHRAHPGGN
jgi:TPR repeat protein